MAVENPYPQNPEFVFSFGAHNPDNTIVLSNAYFEIESYIAQGLHVAYIIEDASASR